MRFSRTATLFLALTAAAITSTATPKTASAQELVILHKTYRVQVEYWFFDTDYYYWSTVFESSNVNEAQLMYELLLIAKENGELNEVVGSTYGRYIAIDVRIVTVYHLPEFQQTWYSDLKPVNVARLYK